MDIYGKITEMTSDEVKNIDSNQIEYISLSSGDIIYIKKSDSQQNEGKEKLNQDGEELKEENKQINGQNEILAEKQKENSLIKENAEIIEENEEENKEEEIHEEMKEVLKEEIKEEIKEIKEEIKKEMVENPDGEVKVEIDVEVKKDENKEGNFIVNKEVKLENLKKPEENPQIISKSEKIQVQNVQIKRPFETIEQMKKRIREEAIENAKKKKALLNSQNIGQFYEKKKQLNTTTKPFNPYFNYNFNKDKNLRTNSRVLFKHLGYLPQKIQYPVYEEELMEYEQQPQYFEQPIYEEQMYYDQMPNAQIGNYNVYGDNYQYYDYNYNLQPFYEEHYQNPYRQNAQIYYQTYQPKTKTKTQKNRNLYLYAKPMFTRLNPNDYYNRIKNKYQNRTFQVKHHLLEKIVEKPKEENAIYSSLTTKRDNKKDNEKANSKSKDNNNEIEKEQNKENDKEKVNENDKVQVKENDKEESKNNDNEKLNENDKEKINENNKEQVNEKDKEENNEKQ